MSVIQCNSMCAIFKLCDDYGKNFEEKYTNGPADGEMGGHRRVVSYKLGPTRLVVRFELDCADSPTASATSTSSQSTASYDDVESLATHLGRVELAAKAKSFDAASKLAYVSQGQLNPAVRLVELTTKSEYRGQRDYPESKINQML